MHPSDAAPRGLTPGTDVRVWNALGEVILQVEITDAVRPGVVSSEKGAARMEAGLVQVRTSGENLKELSNIVRDNSLAVRQIAESGTPVPPPDPAPVRVGLKKLTIRSFVRSAAVTP